MPDGLTIGEVFVGLGIKGTEKSLGALTGVRGGLTGIASDGLAAKAALVGVMYAFERAFAASGAKGTELANFSAMLNMSAQTLQRYQYAAQQVGVSNQSVEGTFKSLQSAMTRVQIGEAPPSGLEWLARMTGGISEKDIDDFAKHPEKLLLRLQEYAQREHNVGLRNEVLKSFGIDDGMIAALVKNSFRPDVMGRAPTYSDKELGQLEKSKAAYANLGQTIDMAFGHFNAKHGKELADGLTPVIGKIEKLAEAFTKLSEKAHLFEWLGKVFEGWTYIFQGLTTAVEALTAKGGVVPSPAGVGKALDKGIDAATSGPEGPVSAFLRAAAERVLGPAPQGTKIDKDHPFVPAENPLVSAAQDVVNFGKRMTGPTDPNAHLPGQAVADALMGRSVAAPSRLPATQPAANQNVTVNQNLNFQHDGKDAQKTGDSTSRAVKHAMQQYAVQGQGG